MYAGVKRMDAYFLQRLFQAFLSGDLQPYGYCTPLFIIA